MSDAELRELEKLARKGDASAKAKWLVARVRSGALSQERLEVAAYAGDEGARRVVLAGRPICECDSRRKSHVHKCPLSGRPAAETTSAFRVPRSLKRWLLELTPERAVIVTAAVATLELFGPLPETRARPSIDAVRFGIRDWLICPCEEHASELEARRKRAWDEVSRDDGSPNWPEFLSRSILWLNSGAATVSAPNLEVWRATIFGLTTMLTRNATTEAKVREAISDALVRWALGAERLR